MIAVVPVLAAIGAWLVFTGATESTRRPSRLRVAIGALTRDAGYPRVSPQRLAVLICGSAVAALLVAATTVSSSVVTVLSFVAGAFTPISFLRSRVRKRQSAHRDVWPEAIALMTSGVRAGVSLPEVLSGLADRGPEILRPHFHAFRSTYRSSNSFAAALDQLADQLADPVADRVVGALRVAHEVGGSDLVRVLRTLGDFVRDDIRVRKEVEARWSWTVNAARLAAASPWIVLIIMSSRPEAAAAYDSPMGSVLVLGGAVATFIGYRLMLRAGRLPDEERLMS